MLNLGIVRWKYVLPKFLHYKKPNHMQINRFYSTMTNTGIKLPVFKNIEEILEFTNVNQSILQFPQFINLLNQFFSLKHFSDLIENATLLEFMNILRERNYLMNTTDINTLIKLAKRYSSIRLGFHEDWAYFGREIKSHLKYLTDGELLNVLHSFIYATHEANFNDKEFWQELIKEIINNSGEYLPIEFIEIGEIIVTLQDMQFPEFWKELENNYEKNKLKVTEDIATRTIDLYNYHQLDHRRIQKILYSLLFLFK